MGEKHLGNIEENYKVKNEQCKIQEVLLGLEQFSLSMNTESNLNQMAKE